jgi:hypothetical protein
LCAEGMVAGALEGFNGAILCYGQTGAGKTHTMSGDAASYAQRGLIPRTLAALLAGLRAAPGLASWSLALSYVEVYNDALFDLLDITTSPSELAVYEDGGGALQVAGARKVAVSSEAEALALFFEVRLGRVCGVWGRGGIGCVLGCAPGGGGGGGGGAGGAPPAGPGRPRPPPPPPPKKNAHTTTGSPTAIIMAHAPPWLACAGRGQPRDWAAPAEPRQQPQPRRVHHPHALRARGRRRQRHGKWRARAAVALHLAGAGACSGGASGWGPRWPSLARSSTYQRHPAGQQAVPGGPGRQRACGQDAQ